ncbi:MAG: hypothetical protein ACI8XB_001797 [Patiriisocius sp.]|jgi:hypothetical protein
MRRITLFLALIFAFSIEGTSQSERAIEVRSEKAEIKLSKAEKDKVKAERKAKKDELKAERKRMKGKKEERREVVTKPQDESPWVDRPIDAKPVMKPKDEKPRDERPVATRPVKKLKESAKSMTGNTNKKKSKSKGQK